jgi:VIT1/CCC1 family predicted Fe2+/Mn2+ transporter
MLPLGNNGIRFPAACLFAAVALFAVGACRSLFSDRPWLIAGLEILVLGAIASAVAYGVGFVAAAMVN